MIIWKYLSRKIFQAQLLFEAKNATSKILQNHFFFHFGLYHRKMQLNFGILFTPHGFTGKDLGEISTPT